MQSQQTSSTPQGRGEVERVPETSGCHTGDARELPSSEFGDYLGPSARLPAAARNDKTSKWPCRHTSSMIRRRADPDHSENCRSATRGPA